MLVSFHFEEYGRPNNSFERKARPHENQRDLFAHDQPSEPPSRAVGDPFPEWPLAVRLRNRRGPHRGPAGRAYRLGLPLVRPAQTWPGPRSPATLARSGETLPGGLENCL